MTIPPALIPTPRQRPQPRMDMRGFPGPAGFTIMELLVVIAIMLFVAGITLPVMNAMYAGSRESAGVNTLSIAVSQARMYATADKNPYDVSSLSDQISYFGAAAIIDQAGDIRLVEHNQPAKDPALAATNEGYLSLQSPVKRGYQDLGLNYIKTPAGVGYVGVVREGSGANNLQLIAPPFAIAFDQQGRLLIAHQAPSGVYPDDRVFYDANYNGHYNTSDDRPTGYKPADHLDRNGSDYSSVEDKWKLPFEALETVVGVIVYDARQIADLASDGSGFLTTSRDEILATGKPVFFSRMTGAPMKDIKKADQ